MGHQPKSSPKPENRQGVYTAGAQQYLADQLPNPNPISKQTPTLEQKKGGSRSSARLEAKSAHQNSLAQQSENIPKSVGGETKEKKTKSSIKTKK